MTNANGTLDDLRREIDEIDGVMHDLLMRRTAIAERIGAAKDDSARLDGTSTTAYLRPAREAAVLRRLVSRHSGAFPLAALVRLWREIMSSVLRLQGPFSVAVYMAPETSGSWPAYWDLARDHYGSTTPMTPCHSPIQVLREVTEGRATVGVLPFPEEGETMPWWPLVANNRPDEPKVIARLPFAVTANNGGRGQVSAIAVARLAPEETGDDRSLFVVEIANDVSRAWLNGALSTVGLPPLWQVAGPEQAGQGSRLYLVESAGFVAADDARLTALAKSLGGALNRVAVIGAYPSPIVQDEPLRQAGAAAGSGRS